MQVASLSPLLIDKYIEAALVEDMNGEDVTTNAIVDPQVKGHVNLIAKEDGIIAGLEVFQRTFELLDGSVRFEFVKRDGDSVQKGERIGQIFGRVRTLLSGERVALNFLQRMSGIASYTSRVVKELEGTKTKILDTRKTTPNFRIFEKYAVRLGGGGNHRYNLTDGVLLKDNHIAAAGSVRSAIEKARAYAPFVRKIEIEVETLEMVDQALDAGADIIMLDNMTQVQMKEAIEKIDGRALVELSGNVNLDNVGSYRDLGADYISSGALTHSAKVLDLSLKGLEVDEERATHGKEKRTFEGNRKDS